MTIQEAKNTIVYYLRGDSTLRDATYYDLVLEAASSKEKTTKDGLRYPFHIRNNSEIWLWVSNDKAILQEKYDTPEEAENELFNYQEQDLQESEKITFFWTLEEAEKDNSDNDGYYFTKIELTYKHHKQAEELISIYGLGEAAKRIGVTTRSLQYLIAEKRKPHDGTATKIQQAYNAMLAEKIQQAKEALEFVQKRL